MQQGSDCTESIRQKSHLINSQQDQGEDQRQPNYRAKLYEFGKGRAIFPVLVLAGGIVLIGLAIVLAVTVLKPCPAPPDFAMAWCPKDWVGFEGNCYFFSEDEGSWDSSQNSCSSLKASLAAIESEEEKAFMLRYKGKSDHWIGLRQEQSQPWKWTNGSEFNNWFPIRGGGDCAYLNDENGVSSSQCYIGRHWICSRPDAFTKRKGRAMERHSQVKGNN